MGKKILFCGFLLITILFSCNSYKKQEPERTSDDTFAGSRLAAQVFNRWKGDQKEAEGTRLQILERVKSEDVQKIHEDMVKIRNRF